MTFDLHRLKRTASIALLLLLAALASGCASVREDVRGEPSQAFDEPRRTTLGRSYAAAEARNPGLSGFRLLNNGVTALLTRGALADLAERSIDLQYYIYDADETGAFLLERLIAAADRGVRVRMILDDYLLGLDDQTLATIDAHRNIEIRIFNPFRDRARWSRSLQMFFRLDTLGRRMHNKVFAVDGQVAILGGRNISNHYFEGEADANFRDIDLIAGGPVVGEVGRNFDAYWNSSIVVPVAAFGAARAGEARGGEAYARFEALRVQARAESGAFAEYRRRKPEIIQRLLADPAEMIWARGRAIAEPPVRQQQGAEKSSSEIARALAIARQNTQREMTYEVAYFVPGKRGVEVMSELAARGVKVRILTNSLASTDVVAVHAGYARYREGLVAAGIALHEYRPDATRPEPQGHRMRMGSSASALHAKVVIHDRKLVWVGSANFDPRSRHLNTETGLLIESPALAERILAGMERDFQPQYSWKLALETDPQTQARSLTWTGEREGRPLLLRSDPDASLWRRLEAGMYSLVPGLEDLL